MSSVLLFRDGANCSSSFMGSIANDVISQGEDTGTERPRNVGLKMKQAHNLTYQNNMHFASTFLGT